MKKLSYFGAILAIIAPAALTASNHDEKFWMTLRRVSFADARYRHATFAARHAKRKAIYKAWYKKRHSYDLTYASDIYLYADETRSGAGGRIQCTWRLNATLTRTIKRRDGSHVEQSTFSAPQIPAGPNPNKEAGSFCGKFEARQATIDMMNGRLRFPFWASTIEADTSNIVKRLGLRPLSIGRISTAPLEGLAKACNGKYRTNCRYRSARATAESLLLATNSSSSGDLDPFSPEQRQTLQIAVGQIGDNSRRSQILDKVVDQVVDILKDISMDKFPGLKPLGIFIGFAFEGVPNGVINEDTLEQIARSTDEQLDAKDTEADGIISTLSADASKTPNTEVSKALTGSIVYYSELKKAIATERGLRNGTLGNGRSGGSHGTATGGGHWTDGAGASPSAGGPGHGAGARENSPPGPVTHEGTQGPAQHDNVGDSFGGMINGRPHDAPGTGHADDQNNGNGTQAPVSIPGPN